MTPNNGTLTTAAATLADLRRAERLAHDSFRAMVDALSHPGRIARLPHPPDAVPSLLLPLLALADIHTSLALLDGDEGRDEPDATTSSQQPEDSGFHGLIHRVTGAPAARPGDADVVVAMHAGDLTGRLVDTMRVGSAHAPELGARVIAAVDALADAESTDPALDVVVTNRGPGASAGRTFRLGGIDPGALRALDRRNDAYPAGIDVWLVDPRGALVGLPRSNRLDVLHEGDR